MSLRGVQHVFKVSRQTVAHWIRDYDFELTLLVDTLLPAHADDVWNSKRAKNAGYGLHYVIEHDRLSPFISDDEML